MGGGIGMKKKFSEMLFELNDYIEVSYRGSTYIGYVLMRDYGGGGINYGSNHSYDLILFEFEGSELLLKHMPESELTLLAKDNTLASKALSIACEKHSGQVDKANKPYIYHIVEVGKNIPKKEDKYLAVAYLHDILEDTNITRESLLEQFPIEVVGAVEAITKKENEKYSDYLKRVKENPIALIVKISDLTHNMDLSRLKEISSNDLKRVEKYRKAIEYLKE